MPNNPDFVRQADHMVHGLVVDMETGWSLSGYDVAPFPEDRQQARFVRQKINAGVLEPASQAEYDEAHPEEDGDDSDAQNFVKAVAAASGRGSGVQEHKIREKESARHSAVQQARAVAKAREAGVDVGDDFDVDEIDFAEDQARREAIADEADEAGLLTDDPEEQEEATATRAARKAPAKKASGTRRRSSNDE